MTLEEFITETMIETDFAKKVHLHRWEDTGGLVECVAYVPEEANMFVNGVMVNEELKKKWLSEEVSSYEWHL